MKHCVSYEYNPWTDIPVSIQEDMDAIDGLEAKLERAKKAMTRGGGFDEVISTVESLRYIALDLRHAHINANSPIVRSTISEAIDEFEMMEDELRIALEERLGNIIFCLQGGRV